MNTSTLRGNKAKLMIQYIKTHERVRIEVVTRSMQPVIYAGDYVIIGHQRRPFFPGDILLCYSNNCFYTHRFIFRVFDKWYLQGDSSRHLDSPINKKQIIGLVVKIEKRNGGIRFDYMRIIALFRAFIFIVDHTLFII